MDRRKLFSLLAFAPALAADYFEKGYKQAQQNLFTEEQVKEAFNAARRFRMKNVFEYEHAGEFLESLKQPRVKVTFEADKPIKAELI